MQQRVQIIRRRTMPSSAVQLPITAALHAENLTLFPCILHHLVIFVNPLFVFLSARIGGLSCVGGGVLDAPFGNLRLPPFILTLNKTA